MSMHPNEESSDMPPSTEPLDDPGPESTTSTLSRRELWSRPWVRYGTVVGAASTAAGVAYALDRDSGEPRADSGPAAAPSAPSDDVAPEPFDRDVHLLRRLTYGPTTADRESIADLGEVAWLAAQADPASLDTEALDAKLAQFPALTMTPVQLDDTFPDTESANFAGAQLKMAFAIRTTESPAQLHERLVEFWSDHFNVPQVERELSLLKIVEDREVIRPNALGTFKDLLVASAQSPAMLLYLDNARSFAGQINENYSRELLELHTLGRGGGYTDDDVVSLARLLTGWSINTTTFEFEFREFQNDPAPLTIMGWTRPAGTDYLQHGVEFLRWLAEQPSTAAHVCTKLARRFVTDAPPDDLVGAMTAAWSANDTAVVPVIEAMIAHPAFDGSAGTKFRRPLDYLSFVLRALRADVTPTTDREKLRLIQRLLVSLGQTPFTWPAPNGFPDVEGAWLNAGAMLGRWNVVGDLVAGVSPDFRADLDEIMVPLLGASAHEIYDGVADALVLRPPTGPVRDLLDEATGWTPSTVPSRAELRTGVAPVVVLLLTSTDVQYR